MSEEISNIVMSKSHMIASDSLNNKVIVSWVSYVNLEKYSVINTNIVYDSSISVL